MRIWVKEVEGIRRRVKMMAGGEEVSGFGMRRREWRVLLKDRVS